MNKCQRLVVWTAISTLLTGCVVTQASRPASPVANDNMYATLYLRTAAEYDALTRSIYASAASMLDPALAASDSAALEQPGDFSTLPPGIIFDVDETVLDNSAYQATLVAENISYSTPHWDGWVAEARADAVPGAVAFSRAAVDKGIALLYLTNRRCIQRSPGGDPCPQRDETIRNLVDAGFPEPDPAQVYLRSAEFDFDRDKGSRRAAFAKNYRIVMLFGDDLGDFVPGAKAPGITTADRERLVAENARAWGRRWFILPNPSYGSWLDVLDNRLYENLQPWSGGKP